MQWQAKDYQIGGDELYKTTISRPLLWCLSKAEGLETLQEVHARICGGHISAHALAAKVLRQGFYGPTMIDDVANLVLLALIKYRFPTPTCQVNV
jgi:hypothetical protein